MTPVEVEDLEIPLLLEAIERRHGIDLRSHARASLRRRIRTFLREERLKTVSGLQEKLLHDSDSMDRFLYALTSGSRELFRDPAFFRTLRSRVFPHLETYPYIRIWFPGCATGEDVYSTAILLDEAGLYDRCRIYATAPSEMALQRAKAGTFALASLLEWEDGYRRAGGTRSLADYYYSSVHGSKVTFHVALTRNVVFAHHDLVSDGSINEFNLIVCRDVMLSFAKNLQERVHALLHQSLGRFGILALGRGESIRSMPQEVFYEELAPPEKLWRKIK